MNLKKRSIIQIIILIFITLICLTYSLYIKDLINYKLLSFADLNPYGGWSELKSAFTDVDYRFGGISKSIALTASVFLSSLLLGRFFCGFICPIGALQDFFSYLGKSLKIKKLPIKNRVNSKLILIKYFVLISILILSILGLGNSISPYSPWLAFLNISLSFNLSLGTLILAVMLILSLLIPRIFCRFLCPLGAFQSLLSAVGFFNIKSSARCDSCTYCLKDCPVDIERPYDNREVSPECISCLRCVDNSCIRGDFTFSVTVFNKKITTNKYIILSLVVFISIYAFLPLTNTSAQPKNTPNFGQLQDGSYIGTGVGFGGPMRVDVVIEEGEIVDIDVLSHRESSGYYEEIFKIKSEEIIQNQNLNVDSVSGATASSRGFFSSIKNAVSQSIKYNEKE